MATASKSGEAVLSSQKVVAVIETARADLDLGLAPLCVLTVSLASLNSH